MKEHVHIYYLKMFDTLKTICTSVPYFLDHCNYGAKAVANQTRTLFFQRCIVMSYLMATKIPFVFHRFVALVTTNISTHCVHIQDVLQVYYVIFRI